MELFVSIVPIFSNKRKENSPDTLVKKEKYCEV